MSLTERIYWIDARIRGGHYPNMEGVRRQFGVSRRTVYQTLRHMRTRLEAPIAYDRARGGWRYTDSTFVLPYLVLAEREVAALRRSALAAQEYLSEEDAALARLLLDNLGTALPAGERARHERVRGAIRLRGGIQSDLLAASERAVEWRQRMRLLYYSVQRDEVNERVVRPYALLHWRGEPHLIAFCEWRQALRQFFLGRVRQWELLPGEAAYSREAFDVDAYLARGLGVRHGEEMVTVRARFSPYQARWIRERAFHESQQIEDLPDGGLLLTVYVAGIEEVRRWLLGYGAEVEVIEPASLRAEMAKTVKRLQQIYEVSVSW